MAAERKVDLGFINSECEPGFLESHYFPSKVGGKPAWLSFKPLPTSEQLMCSKCNKQMVFLLQVYSPRDKPEEDAFHRTLFLFACRNPDCNSVNSGENFKVFRSQLPRKNDFFSPDPPPDELSEDPKLKPSASRFQPLCEVCGCIGSKQCSRCHSANYCGKDHQTLHWRASHKKTCGKQVPQGAETVKVSGVLFPEFELEIEEENYTPEVNVKEEQAIEAYQQYVTDNMSRGTSQSEFTEQDLTEMATQETEDDKQFERFQKRVAANNDQVLRYCKGGEPLWVSSDHQANEQDIPACSCGAPRLFEFQVMPQLLSSLEVDDMAGNSLDWGTLCVYTCRDSCKIDNSYVTEFVWKQDFLNPQ